MTAIDLKKIGCDAFAASLHKWILAPIGNGMAWVSRDSRNKFRSLYDEQSTVENPNYAPIGTADLPTKAAVADALKFINNISIQAIEKRNRYLSNHLKTLLTQRPGIKLLSGADNLSCPGSTIFELPGIDPVEEVARLESLGIYIDEHVRDGHHALRISTHFYNSIEEIERVVNILGKS
jgi:selenocysteine lyase/cysteine desulfurase